MSPFGMNSPAPTPPPAPVPASKNRPWQGAMSRKVGIIATGAALVAGLTVGATAAGSGAESAQQEADVATTALSALNDDLTAVTAERDAERSRADDLATQLAVYKEAEKKAAAEAAAKAEAEAKKKAEAEAKQKAEAEAKQKAEAEAEAQRRADEQAAAEAGAARQAADTAPRGFVDTGQQQESSGQSNVYYRNCTAAHDAGAAPVYRGDPGYGNHLDRDDDGVGCE